MDSTLSSVAPATSSVAWTPHNPPTTGDQLHRIRDACVQLRGPVYCTDTVVQAVGALARHETGFGQYKPFAAAGFQSNNWGAQQCSVVADKNGQCPANCFPARDTSPTSTGANIAYQACFLVNPTPEAGALSLTRLVTVSRPGIAAALPSGDLQVIAQAMRDARYYEGFGKTQAERVRNYAVALERNGKLNAQQAGAKNLLVLPPDPAAPAPSASTSPAPSTSAVLVDSAPGEPQPTGGDGDIATGFGLMLLAALARWLRPSAPTSTP